MLERSTNVNRVICRSKNTIFKVCSTTIHCTFCLKINVHLFKNVRNNHIHKNFAHKNFINRYTRFDVTINIVNGFFPSDTFIRANKILNQIWMFYANHMLVNAIEIFLEIENAIKPVSMDLSPTFTYTRFCSENIKDEKYK